MSSRYLAQQVPGPTITLQDAHSAARPIWEAVCGPQLVSQLGYVDLAKDLFEYWMAQPPRWVGGHFDRHRVGVLIDTALRSPGGYSGDKQLPCDVRRFLHEDGARGALTRWELLGEGKANPLEALIYGR